MRLKTILAFAALLMAASVIILIDESEQSDAASITITFDPQEGTVSPDTKIVEYPGTYGALPTPVRAGYSFYGWCTQPIAAAGTMITSSSSTPLWNTTLYAIWIAETYTVAYNYNGGVDNDLSTQLNNPGTYAKTAIIAGAPPTRDGYTLVGWTVSGNLDTSTAYYVSIDEYNVITNVRITSTSQICYTNYTGSIPSLTSFSELGTDGGTVTLNAVWNMNTYNISYALNGGTAGERSPTTVSIGGTFVVDAPTKSGYIFAGWTVSGANVDYSNAVWGNNALELNKPIESSATVCYNGSTAPIWFDELTQISNSTITLTAIWSSGYYSLVYDLNGAYEHMDPQLPDAAVIGRAVEIHDVYYRGYIFAGWTVSGADVDYSTAKWGYSSSDLNNNISSASTLCGSAGQSTFFIDLSTTSGGTVLLTANWTINNLLVTFDATTNGGTLVGNPTKTVVVGESYGTLPSATKSGYYFDGWYTASSGGVRITSDTIVQTAGNQTLYAQFNSNPLTDEVYWSNDLYNGSVTLAYRFTGGNNNMDHIMDIILYDGSVTDMITTWADSGYSLNIELSYPRTVVQVTLLKNGVPTAYVVNTEIGQWPGFEISINADKGYVTFTPMNHWTNFTSYSVYQERERVILDWSAETKGQAIYMIEHSEDGTGAHPSFQVVRTMPFLNTYGVVLTDPAINVYSYFPEYDSVRLNFNSFAIYGNSMTVNNKTMSVFDGKVTIYYITNDEVNTWVNIGTPDALSKTFTLSNINITWQEGTCTLTFVSDKFSVDMGPYSAGSETVSFAGFWYFTADLYEPVTSTETVISGDWDYLPDIGAPVMLLIYLGCLFAFAVLAQAEKGLKWMDATILIIAGLIGFILLG